MVVHHELRQSHGLFYDDVAGSGYLFDVVGGLFGFAVEFLHLFAVELHGNVGFGSGHQLVEAQLDGLRKVELSTVGERFEGLLHLFYQLGTAACAGPLLEGLHHNHHVGIFHGHRVGRHLGCSNLGYDVAYLGELLHQALFGQFADLDAFGERATGRKRHLHGKVALVEGGDELCSQPGEEQQAQGQGGEGNACGKACTVQTAVEQLHVVHREALEEAVGKGGLDLYLPLEEE